MRGVNRQKMIIVFFGSRKLAIAQTKKKVLNIIILKKKKRRERESERKNSRVGRKCGNNFLRILKKAGLNVKEKLS